MAGSSGSTDSSTLKERSPLMLQLPQRDFMARTVIFPYPTPIFAAKAGTFSSSSFLVRSRIFSIAFFPFPDSAIHSRYFSSPCFFCREFFCLIFVWLLRIQSRRLSRKPRIRYDGYRLGARTTTRPSGRISAAIVRRALRTSSISPTPSR